MTTMSKEKVKKQLTTLYQKAKDAKKDTFFFKGAFLPSKWMKEHGALSDEDYIKIIEEYNGKVLAITGKCDLQADYTCLDKIAEFENVTTYAPENVNHMLKEIDDNNSYLSVQKQYKRLAKNPIHEETQKLKFLLEDSFKKELDFCFNAITIKVSSFRHDFNPDVQKAEQYVLDKQAEEACKVNCKIATPSPHEEKVLKDTLTAKEMDAISRIESQDYSKQIS